MRVIDLTGRHKGTKLNPTRPERIQRVTDVISVCQGLNFRANAMPIIGWMNDEPTTEGKACTYKPTSSWRNDTTCLKLGVMSSIAWGAGLVPGPGGNVTFTTTLRTMSLVDSAEVLDRGTMISALDVNTGLANTLCVPRYWDTEPQKVGFRYNNATQHNNRIKTVMSTVAAGADLQAVAIQYAGEAVPGPTILIELDAGMGHDDPTPEPAPAPQAGGEPQNADE